MDESGQIRLSQREIQMFQLLNYSHIPVDANPRRSKQEKIDFGRSSFIFQPQTPINVSPMTYTKKFTELDADRSMRILSIDNQRELRYEELSRQFNDPGRYEIVRNISLKRKSPNTLDFNAIHRLNKEEEEQDAFTLVALTQKKAYECFTPEVHFNDERDSFIPKPETSPNVSPMTYQKKRKQPKATDIYLKYGAKERVIEQEIRQNASVGPAAYTLGSDFNESKGHDIYHNNRVNKWYLESLGFSEEHGEDKYYRTRTTIKEPAPILYGEDRFKRVDNRRENVFLGPGSHNITRH